jgi:hypothetical protein
MEIEIGMGPGARSNGAQLTGIVTDFNIPVFADASTAGGTPRGTRSGPNQ